MPRPTTITAELKQWQLDDERCIVSGVIHNPSCRDYIEGETWNIIGFKHTTEFAEYILVCTHLNNYFKLYRSEMK